MMLPSLSLSRRAVPGVRFGQNPPAQENPLPKIIGPLVTAAMKHPDDREAHKRHQEALVQALASAPLKQAQAAQTFLQGIKTHMDGNRDRYDTGTRLAVAQALTACQVRVTNLEIVAERDTFLRQIPPPPPQ